MPPDRPARRVCYRLVDRGGAAADPPGVRWVVERCLVVGGGVGGAALVLVDDDPGGGGTVLVLVGDDPRGAMDLVSIAELYPDPGAAAMAGVARLRAEADRLRNAADRLDRDAAAVRDRVAAILAADPGTGGEAPCPS